MFARRNANGSLTVSPMDMSHAGDGQLMKFNGPMPGYEPPEAPTGLVLDLSQLNSLRTMEIGTNLPSSNAHFFPVIRERTDVKVPPRVDRPSNNGDGGVYGGTTSPGRAG
jgi:hypothetical protein